MERENLFFEVNEGYEKENKIFILVIYDIVDNKKRVKFAKHLNGYGSRVQKSAFEGFLTKQKYDKLIKEIPSFISSEDNVRVYKLHGRGQISAWGIQDELEEEDIILI